MRKSIQNSLVVLLFLQKSTEGVRIRESIAETCQTNFQRLSFSPEVASGRITAGQPKEFETYLGSGSLYKDASFPANSQSLFWADHLPDNSQELLTAYKTRIDSWKRPSEVMNLVAQDLDVLPSLWGENGVEPSNAVT
jgi:hypothetical protein